MWSWQRRARLVIAIGAIAFAVVVAFAFKPRAPVAPASVASSDSGAVVDSTDGTTVRITREHQDVVLSWKKLQTYADGTSKMIGVSVDTERASGRHFKMTGDEGQLGKNESDFTLAGHVQIEVSDGMLIRTERASYKESEAVLHAPGPVQIERGRLTGSSRGMRYDKSLNQVTLLDHVSMRMAPDVHGAGSMAIESSTALFNRNDKTVHFDHALRVVYGSRVISADAAVARLSVDEERLEAFELRGNARITSTKVASGGLRSLTGRDVDLTYGPDGETIEHAVITGNAVIQLAGATRQAGRQIAGNTVDVSLAPDGSTPTRLSARDNVQLVFPAEQDHGTRTITAQALDCGGDEQHGLTRAHFDGAVRFREQSATVTRSATSQTLDAAMGPGMSSIDEARFARTVQFTDGSMTATSAEARYLLDKGTLELSGGGANAATPRVDTEQIGIDATKIAVTLAGPLVQASGSVKSVLKHPKKDAGAAGKADATKMPSMLKADQDVMVTASDLDYDGTHSKATYTGLAKLSQGETSIKATTIVIDDKSGDLTATGSDKESVLTSIVREEPGKDQKAERVRSDAKARDLKYEDATRRLTYAGEAHMVGAAGDMTADKIEVYLKPSGDEIEHVEAYDHITLRETTSRTTTGNRLTYVSANEQYTISGTPVDIVKTACSQHVTGKTVTLFKTNDRIVVDGAEQNRTQTTGGTTNCPQ